MVWLVEANQKKAKNSETFGARLSGIAGKSMEAGYITDRIQTSKGR